ncbi:MAG TPA: ABC transporter permease [Paludibacteraceae bacterium]|nr:ABC transporter permease [Paludibacteraceae bacterium]
METIEEIISTLKHNKMRTVLTGLSVSWGIFILIVLLGAGNGLKNGVTSNFSDRATNTVQMWPGHTTKPYKGLKTNRQLNFTEKEIDNLKENVKESDEETGIIEKSVTVTYKTEFGNYELKGVDPSYAKIINLKFIPGDGRFINSLDVQNNSKVIVIDKKVEENLFKGKPALGEYVKVGSVMFRVIGINSKKEQFAGTQVYIPFNTAQRIYNPDKKFWSIAFTTKGLETKQANEDFDENLKKTMSQTMFFDPKDEQALWIRNAQRDYIETMNIFNGINIFVSIIGIFTLIAGIVGVSNIMLVSVKERTREIGIRKAIGAPPATILISIVIEAVLITALFGYIGMMMGIGLTEIVNFVMEKGASKNTSDMQMTVFKNPTVQLSYVFFSTTIIIIAGVIAGYMPARRATRIKPIEAMREE